MIIRKPYAFLIKNFRKIHIFLLILSIYVAYKLIDVSAFVNDFMKYESYDLFQNPITKHITTLLLFSIVLLVIGSVSLLFLLRHKKKPWKIYLVPTTEYLVLFFVLGMIKGFFGGYSTGVETTDLRMSRDLLMIFTIVQIPAIGIFAMRFFGLDIKKFEFNTDKEFLELSEEDREEIEIGLSIDKNSFIRTYRRFLRYLNYFYLEHKNICRVTIGIIIFIFIFKGYQFIFVENKSYKQGDNYYANGYTFKINHTYFTNTDYRGDVIEENSNFVVIDLTITNNSEPREIYLENFHIRSGTNDYITTRTTYAKEFQDLGKTYQSVKKLKRDETLNCIIVYKVDKKIKMNHFTLFYQELNGKDKLRKIKLKPINLNKDSAVKKINLGDDLKIPVQDNSDTISIDKIDFGNEFNYMIKNCTVNGCETSEKKVYGDSTNTILKIEFSSGYIESKNMIDFLMKYGKIEYKDDSGDSNENDVVNAVSRKYFGKVVFLLVPEDITEAKEITINLSMRNKKYYYKIK